MSTRRQRKPHCLLFDRVCSLNSISLTHVALPLGALQHDIVVSGMDWCPLTNKLVTCSHDRNAFVWVFDAATQLWKPQVVVLNINRAATDVKWSPDGTKFAVSSAAKIAMLCRYDEANDWWVSTALKKHKSTVLSLAWHPNSRVLATVATDYRCRIISAYLDDMDSTDDGGVFGPLPPAGEVLDEFDVTRAWVNHCAWSPSGSMLAFAGHDSLLHIATFNPDRSVAPIIQTIKCPTLPAMRVQFLSENCLVTAGHSMNPELFGRNDGAAASAAAAAVPVGAWTFLGYVDRKPDAASGAAGKITNSFASARGMFASKVLKGESSSGGGGAGTATNGSAESSSDWIKHKNAITYLQPCKTSGKLLALCRCVLYRRSSPHSHRVSPVALCPPSPSGAASGAVVSFSTSGNDGRVIVWPLLELSLPGINLAALGVA